MKLNQPHMTASLNFILLKKKEEKLTYTHHTLKRKWRLNSLFHVHHDDKSCHASLSFLLKQTLIVNKLLGGWLQTNTDTCVLATKNLEKK